MNIRGAIVEDDRAVRDNLAVLIDGARGFECIGRYPNAEEACDRLTSLFPDVVLMDIHLPGISGISCVSRLRTLLPQTQIIMLTIEEDVEQVFESLKAGAMGY